MLLSRHTRRRDFIAGISAVAWPLTARAQQQVPVIGLLHPGSPESGAVALAAFRQGLIETGFVEGRNVAVELRWGQNDFNRLADLATDLVRRRVTVIVTLGSRLAALAAKAATTTIPIVFGNVADPVEAGLVASLSRPGGNVTGFSDMADELVSKWLGLLSELLPAAMRFAVLVNPDNAFSESRVGAARAAASIIGRQIEVLTARTDREIDTVFESLVRKRADALLILGESLFFIHRVQLVTLAGRHAVPALYYSRVFVEGGGLMSYGASVTDLIRQVGIYAGRILKGEKPAELPVVRPTKFEFVINLKTAKMLGIEFPPGLLAIADHVIE